MADTKKGRPNKYSHALAVELCNEIAEGKSLRTICKSEKYPSKTTIFRWLLDIENKEFDSFRDQYALARKMQAEGIADEIFDICDDGSNDYMENNEGREALNAENIGRSRLRVDTRKWYLSKVLPKFKGEDEKDDGIAEALRDIADKLPG